MFWKRKKPDSNNRSNDGYERERAVLGKSLEVTKDWKSVSHTDGRGRPIGSLSDSRKGPDGGIDFSVRIETKDEKSASRLLNWYIKRMKE